MDSPNEEFFFLATAAMITVKTSFTHFHRSSFQGKYSLIKIMHPISPNYSLENRVKQGQGALARGSKCVKHFLKFLPLFVVYLRNRCNLFNMSCVS